MGGGRPYDLGWDEVGLSLCGGGVPRTGHRDIAHFLLVVPHSCNSFNDLFSLEISSETTSTKICRILRRLINPALIGC